MNKYVETVLFYILSVIFLFLINRISPDLHDGGMGFGSIAIIFVVSIVFVMFIINLIKGIKKDKSYLILTVVHFIALLIGARYLLEM